MKHLKPFLMTAGVTVVVIIAYNAFLRPTLISTFPSLFGTGGTLPL